jgi:hypothetical protein
MADDDVTPKAPRKIVIKHRGEGANVGGGAVASVYAQPAAADHTHAARAATTGASTSQNPGGGDEPAKVVSPWEEVQALFVPRRLPFKRRPMPLPEKGKGGRYSKLKQAVKMERLELLPASEPTCAPRLPPGCPAVCDAPPHAGRHAESKLGFGALSGR